MTRRPFWLLLTVTVLILGSLLITQLRATRENQRVQESFRLSRQRLFGMLRPVALSNCELERFGEANDGGYLMCANLLGEVGAAYSYGISGYDKWGCDISTRLNLPVHQYDCFDTTVPACPAGRTVFHAECVADTKKTSDGRAFDTIENQLAKNGDRSKRLVVKIDVEGAEWESFMSLPDDILASIDQMSVEFHFPRDEQGRWIENERDHLVMQRLKQVFEIAHVHFNNAGCATGLDPFTTWAYEVLFVNKRLAVVDPSRTVSGLHPLDAPNSLAAADCQPAPW